LLFRRKAASMRKIIPKPGNIAAYSQFIQGTRQTPMLFSLFQLPQNPTRKGLATRAMPVLRAGSPPAGRALAPAWRTDDQAAGPVPPYDSRKCPPFLAPEEKTIHSCPERPRICERISWRYRMEQLTGLRRLYAESSLSWPASGWQLTRRDTGATASRFIEDTR
jgi:hypothetical protein